MKAKKNAPKEKKKLQKLQSFEIARFENTKTIIGGGYDWTINITTQPD